MFVFPLLLVLLLAVGFEAYGALPAVQGALKGIAAVVAALIACTAAKMLPALRGHPGGRWFCGCCAAVTLAMVLVLHWPLHWVLGSVGLFAWAWTFHRLGSSRPPDPP